MNAAYNNETPYSAFPYVSTINTGSNLADYALGTLGGVWNLAANVLNIPFNAGGLFEEGYNAGTKLVLGQEGFSGGGLAVDSFMWAQMGVPVGAVTQSLQCARTYFRAAAPLSKLKSAYHASSLADEAGSLTIGTSNGLKKFPEWQLNDPITKITAEGKYPTWETIRSRYWKNRAFQEPNSFGAANRAIMQKGYAPKARVLVQDRKTGVVYEKLVEKELHHALGNPGTPGFDEPFALREVWPWEHETLTPSGRQVDYDFIQFK